MYCAWQILDPNDPTLYDCAGSSPCNEYNGNGGDLCTKAGSKMFLPCCSSIATALSMLCSGVDPTKVASVLISIVIVIWELH